MTHSEGKPHCELRVRSFLGVFTVPLSNYPISRTFTRAKRRASRLYLRDPTQEWWIPQPLPPDEWSKKLTEAYEKFEEIVTDCCFDSTDAAAVQTLMIANCSLRIASMYTGIPKTTLARRRDVMIERVTEKVVADAELYETLLGTGSVDELHEVGEPTCDESP